MGAPPWGKLGAGEGGPLAGSVSLLPGLSPFLYHPESDLRADTDPVRPVSVAAVHTLSFAERLYVSVAWSLLKYLL